jgi:hypothetical protein
VESRASGIGSAMSNINSAAVSGISSAISTISNIGNDKRIYTKVIPYDIIFMQKLLKLFNFFGLFIGLMLLAVVTAGLMQALNENCLTQPFHSLIVPARIEKRPEGYMCTGNRLITKADIVPKINMILLITGLFFAVQAKLFGFMGSAFMVVPHMFTYVLCFVLAYILIGLAALVELGTSKTRLPLKQPSPTQFN